MCGLHSRQHAGEGKTLGQQVCQVAVHEDKEGLDLTDIVGETCGEGSHESKQKAEDDTADCRHKELGKFQKHISGFDNMQVCQKGGHAVKCLGDKDRKKDYIQCSARLDGQ